MRFLFVLSALLFALPIIAGEGELQNTQPDKYNIASMADWAGSKPAKATSVVFATTYGAALRFKQINNLSGSVVKLSVLYWSGDTCPVHLNAYQSSGKRPRIRAILSGAVVDSLTYDYQTAGN